MLSTKTYLLLNVNKTFWTPTVFALTDRFMSSLNTNPSIGPNRTERTPILIQYRTFAAEKPKSGQKVRPIQVSYVDDEPRLTHMERLKRVIQNYGSTAVVLHILISLTSLGSIYSLMYFGFDITSHIPLDSFGETAGKIMAGSGTFAVAYAIHKMIMPFRIGATVLLTPMVVQQLRKLGVIKKHKHI